MKFRLKDLREDMDLRQIDVAKATGIDQRTLSNYETCKTAPDMYSLIALADFFGVSLDYLTGRSDVNIIDNISIAEKLKDIVSQLLSIISAISKKN